MFSKSLIHFSLDGQCCVPSLLFDLRSNCGGGNEDIGQLLQIPATLHRPPSTHASAGDSWSLMGNSRSASRGVSTPFSWIRVHTRFCLCPPSVCFPSQSCVSSDSSVVGLMVTSSKKAYVVHRSAALRAPAPVVGHC